MRRVPRQRPVVVVVELRMSPRRSVLRPVLRLARAKGRASSWSFAVRIEREAGVPLVVDGLNRRGTEQRSLLVEHFDALRKRDATEIHQGGDKASRDLGRPAPAIRISSKAR